MKTSVVGQEIIVISGIGSWKGQKSPKPLGTEPTSWRSVTPLGTESYLNFIWFDYVLAHLCRPHQGIRAAPTVYGTAEMASPLKGSNNSSSSKGSSKGSKVSSKGSSDGDSTQTAIILPCLDAEATLAPGDRRLRFV